MPQENIYNTAIDMIDEDFKVHGGAWGWTYDEEMRIVEESGTRKHMDEIDVIARRVEPRETDGSIVDPATRATLAFTHGVLVGQQLAGIVHDSAFPPRFMTAALNHSTILEGIGAHERSGSIREFGQQGLDIAGNYAKERIEAWSDAVVHDVTVRRLYSLGCGAVIMTAHSLQYLRNEEAVTRFVDTFSWNDHPADGASA